MWGATTGFSSWEINDATWHPKDPKIAWFGTLMGPYKSSDGGDAKGRLLACAPEGERGGQWRWDGSQPDGQRWTRLWEDRWVSNVAVDPAEPQQLAIITNQNPYTELSQATGVWLSPDGGTTWSQANAGLAMLRGVAVAFDPFDTTQIIAGTMGSGFYKITWPAGAVPPGERKNYRHIDADTKFTAVAEDRKTKP